MSWEEKVEGWAEEKGLDPVDVVDDFLDYMAYAAERAPDVVAEHLLMYLPDDILRGEFEDFSSSYLKEG